MVVSKALVTAYANRFLGYGSIKSDWWFVGLQEGIGDASEFVKRIHVWNERGKRPLENLKGFHRAFCCTQRYYKLFAADGANHLQPTWRGLIRIYLSATSPPRTVVTREMVRRFQSERISSEVALLELYPFPAPSIARTREQLSKYFPAAEIAVRLNTLRDARAKKIGQLVRKHKPKVVVFYGLGSLCQWREVVGDPAIRANRLYQLSGGGRCIVIPHIASHGIKNLDLEAIGQRLRVAYGVPK